MPVKTKEAERSNDHSIPYARQTSEATPSPFMVSDEMADYTQEKHESGERPSFTDWRNSRSKAPENFATDRSTTLETEEIQEEQIEQTPDKVTDAPDPSNEDEKNKRAGLGGKGLANISKALGPEYDYKKLQKEWFPSGTNFSERWPNLIIRHYLIKRGWKITDSIPYVTHTIVNGRLVILSTFTSEKVEGKAIDTDTAYNYIAINGLTEISEAGFHLINSKEEFDATIETGVISGGKAIAYEFEPIELEESIELSYLNREEQDFYTAKLEGKDLLTGDDFSSEKQGGLYQLARDYYEYLGMYSKKSGTTTSTGIWGISTHTPASKATLTDIDKKEVNLKKNLKANGFNTIQEFSRYLSQTKAKHLTFTVNLANTALGEYEVKVQEKEKKFKDEAYVSGLYQSLQSVIKLHDNVSTRDGYYNQPVTDAASYYSGQTTPDRIIKAKKNITKYSAQVKSEAGSVSEKYPELDANDKKMLYPRLGGVQDLDDFKEVINDYIADKQSDIKKTRETINEDPESVYKMDNLISISRSQLSVKENTLSDLVITRAVNIRAREDQVVEFAYAAGTISLALAATAVTGGGAAPVAAGVLTGTSVSLSLYDAFRTLDNYLIEDAAGNLGFSSDDPSVVWVIVAFVGAGLDVGPLIKSLKTVNGLKPALDTFRKTGVAGEFEKSIKSLKGLGETEGDLLKVTDRLVDSRLAYKKALNQRYNTAVENFAQHLEKAFTLGIIDNPFKEPSFAKAFADLLSVSIEKKISDFADAINQLRKTSPESAKLLDENPNLREQIKERYEEGIKNADSFEYGAKLDDELRDLSGIKKGTKDEVIDSKSSLDGGERVSKAKGVNFVEVDKIDGKLINITDKEHVYRIDKHGNIFGPEIGSINKVNFNDLGPFKNGDIITHNHPSGATFSLDDIFNLSALNITELRAITKNKKYIIRKTGTFNYSDWRLKYDKLVSEFRTKYADKFKQVMSFEDKILIQEELYKKAFKDTNVEFIIE